MPQGGSGSMLTQKILKFQSPKMRFPTFWGLNWVQKCAFFRGMPVAHHGKNPVWFVFHCTNKLQSQPIGLRKIFIDYFFFQDDQWDCTKSLSIFNRFASSEERFRTSLPNLSFVSFPTRGLGWFVNQQNPSEYWQVKGGDLGQILVGGTWFQIDFSSRSSPVFAEHS